jgi:fused signal recognition particle receptor
MNPPNQPTPRTNAAWAKTFESELNQFWSGNAANQMRDECEKLERELTETERLRFGADADRRRLRAEVERLTAKIGNQADRIRYLEGATNHATGTPLSKAIARAEKAEAAFADPHTLHAHCLRTLTEGQIAHLFGERMTAIVNRAEKAEAELAEAKVERETIAQSSLRSLEAYMDKLKQFAERAEKAEAECLEQARLLGMSGEREADLLGKLGRLESELAAIKNGHGELGKYEQLRLKNAELQRDKARLDWLAVSDTWFDSPATESFNPETFRDAIDAAMKGTP